MTERIREEVINVVFAQKLSSRGLSLVVPEIVGKRKKSDIIVDLYGLRLLIEGRKEHMEKGLFRDIKVKLQEGYGDIGIAILYPNRLYEIKEIGELGKKIEKYKFSGSVFYWTSKGLKSIKYQEKGVGNIVELIRETMNIYIKNDILKEQIGEINHSIEKIVKIINIPDLWLSDKELLKKLKMALGVSSYEKEEKK